MKHTIYILLSCVLIIILSSILVTPSVVRAQGAQRSQGLGLLDEFTETPTETPSPTGTMTETATPSSTSTATNSVTPTMTRTASITPTASKTPTATITPTPRPISIVMNDYDSGPGSLRQVVASAVPGSVIIFDPYLAGDTIALSSPITISQNVIIDGSSLEAPIEISGEHAVRIFSIQNNVTLRSLVLKNGKTTGTSYTNYGAAVFMAATSKTLDIIDVSFFGNYAYEAGALYVGSSSVVNVSESEFISNGSDNSGGAIAVQGDLSLRNSLFQDNSTMGSGGAIYFHSSQGAENVVNNYFLGNSALAGGAVSLYLSYNATFANNLFAENASTHQGGAVSMQRADYGEIVFANNTFYDNHAGSIGGGVYTDGHILLRNNTFSNNQANQSAAAGGNLYLSGSATVSKLYNNILANNAGGGDCTASYNVIVYGNNNVVEDGSAICLPSVTGDPLLGPLADNGGPTLSMALLPGSPAIDAGDDASCAVTDQRGAARPQGAQCDPGAFEYEGDVPTATPTSAPTNTPEPTSTRTSTSTPTPTATKTATPTPTLSPTFTASLTSTVSPTPTASPTSTPTPTPSPTLTASLTSTVSPTPTASLTPTSTPTQVLVNRTFESIASQDGWILESSENSTTGGTINSTDKTFRLGDDIGDRQYRTILSFNTSALPDNAVVQSVVLKIKHVEAIVGSNPFNVLGTLWVDIHKNPFGLSALQTSDFQNAASAQKVGGFNAKPALGWYSVSLNTSGLNNINKSGVTQFRLYFGIGDNDNHKADMIKFVTGDSPNNKPALVITYYRP